jgi:DNA-binding transcriptional regulator YhcF (GntR family)
MNIELKDLTNNPVYLQVRQQIETNIRNRTLSAGEQLPSPAALAQKLSVDKGEIQRAYFELEQLGLVTKQTGKDFLGKPRTDYRVAAASNSK